MLRNRMAADREVAATESSSVSRATWSPAQLISLLVGLAFVVMGGVGLARTGFNFDPMATTEVAGLSMSAAFALGALIFGALILGCAAVPGGARGGMGVTGVVAIAFGLVVAIEPTTFGDSLAVEASMGWLMVIAGAVLLLGAMFSPIYSSVRSGSRVQAVDDSETVVPVDDREVIR